MFSWKRWTSTKFVPNKRQMWLSCSEYRSYLYVVWSKIPWFSTCYLEPTVRKDTWTSFVTTMLFFFRKLHSEGYLITAMFKVPSQQLRGTLKTAYWKIPLQLNILFHQDFGTHHETKTDESPWKKVSCTKIRACTSENITLK